jgi:hypothetical protein
MQRAWGRILAAHCRRTGGKAEEQRDNGCAGQVRESAFSGRKITVQQCAFHTVVIRGEPRHCI